MDFIGFRWISLDLSGFQDSSLQIMAWALKHGFHWISLDFNGFDLDFHGFQMILLDFSGFQEAN